MTPPGPAVACLDGWYAEEHDGIRPFRWMDGDAGCRVTGLAPGGQAWLQIIAACPRPDGARPILSLVVDGRAQESGRVVGAGAASWLFRLDAPAGAVDVRLRVDRTFTVPGDPRRLGVMVRDARVVDGAALADPLDAEGWHEWESHEYFPYRWMGTEARLLLPAAMWQSGRFASVPVCSELDAGSQTLTVMAAGTIVAELPLLHQWHVYEVALPAAGPATGVGGAGLLRALDLAFRVDRLLPPACHPSDPRELGVRVGAIEIHDDRRRHERVRLFHESARPAVGDTRHPANGDLQERRRPASAPPSPAEPDVGGIGSLLPGDGEGWHPWEFQEHIPFRWMKREARMAVTAAKRRGCRFAVVPLFSEFDDLSQVLTVTGGGGKLIAEIPLVYKWGSYGLRLPDSSDAQALDLGFRLNKVVPPEFHPDEPRELGIHVGPIDFHDDEARHEQARFSYENAVRNQRELEAGTAVLASFPLNVGIDLYGRCNIKPPCVYCLWDPMKELEGGAVDAVVDDETLAGYGDFFAAARSFVNCSFGEPLLHPRFEHVLDFFARHDKTAELSTNGQAFTPRTIRALAGRRLFLYVSLDAATAETYARLRNDRWPEVIAGLTHLREARRRALWLPKLFMVFMPMRANLQDVEAYVKLCRMVHADALVLRPLLRLESPGIVADRGGYRYDYEREILSREELEAVFDEVARHAAHHDVRIASQFDFGIERPAKRAVAAGAAETRSGEREDARDR